MIVELQTHKPIVVDTTHPQLSVSEQVRLSLIRTPYIPHELHEGFTKITPTRRLISRMLDGISYWIVHVKDNSHADLHTVYRAITTPRGAVMLPPTITPVEETLYYPVGTTNRRGRIRTDRIVANIPDEPRAVSPSIGITDQEPLNV